MSRRTEIFIIRTCFKGHRNDIQHHNLRSPLRKELHDLSTNATSSSGNDHNFAIPIILIVCPVVQDPSVEVRADPSEDAIVEELAESREGGRMVEGEVGAALREAGGEEEGEREEWVEGGTLDEASDGVGGEACWRMSLSARRNTSCEQGRGGSGGERGERAMGKDYAHLHAAAGLYERAFPR